MYVFPNQLTYIQDHKILVRIYYRVGMFCGEKKFSECLHLQSFGKEAWQMDKAYITIWMGFSSVYHT